MAVSPPREHILVRRAVMEAIVAHARAEAPLECCGLLVGSPDLIERVHPARNLLASPSRYQIDPEAHFEALREARIAGVSVVGAYHSHPLTAAVPSPRDLEEADDPSLVHLIVSLAAGRDAQPAVAAFRVAAGNFRSLAVVLTG